MKVFNDEDPEECIDYSYQFNLPKADPLEIRIKEETIRILGIFPTTYNPIPGLSIKEITRYYIRD